MPDPKFPAADLPPAVEPSNEDAVQDEAQRAADGLKDQIAVIRDRIRQAREALTEHAHRENQGRSAKR